MLQVVSFETALPLSRRSTRPNSGSIAWGMKDGGGHYGVLEFMSSSDYIARYALARTQLYTTSSTMWVVSTVGVCCDLHTLTFARSYRTSILKAKLAVQARAVAVPQRASHSASTVASIHYHFVTI